MDMKDYFEVVAPDDIRVKGTRVGIETILNDYLDLGLFPEDIVLRYPTLSLEAVYATITYYWGHQQEVDAYLRAWKAHSERMRHEQEAHPSQAARSLRDLLRQGKSVASPPPAGIG